MAAITDLTWQQLLDKLPANAIVIDPETTKVMIDVSVVAGITADALTDAGVCKSLATLLNAGYNAQIAANENQVAGERLAAFAAPVNGAIASGFVPITRGIITRAELSSATNIVAPNS